MFQFKKNTILVLISHWKKPKLINCMVGSKCVISSSTLTSYKIGFPLYNRCDIQDRTFLGIVKFQMQIKMELFNFLLSFLSVATLREPNKNKTYEFSIVISYCHDTNYYVKLRELEPN
jgi:hypothetical protein